MGQCTHADMVVVNDPTTHLWPRLHVRKAKVSVNLLVQLEQCPYPAVSLHRTRKALLLGSCCPMQ
jgi:hypothetical protein